MKCGFLLGSLAGLLLLTSSHGASLSRLDKEKDVVAPLDGNANASLPLLSSTAAATLEKVKVSPSATGEEKEPEGQKEELPLDVFDPSKDIQEVKRNPLIKPEPRERFNKEKPAEPSEGQSKTAPAEGGKGKNEAISLLQSAAKDPKNPPVESVSEDGKKGLEFSSSSPSLHVSGISSSAAGSSSTSSSKPDALPAAPAPIIPVEESQAAIPPLKEKEPEEEDETKKKTPAVPSAAPPKKKASSKAAAKEEDQSPEDYVDTPNNPSAGNRDEGDNAVDLTFNEEDEGGKKPPAPLEDSPSGVQRFPQKGSEQKTEERTKKVYPYPPGADTGVQVDQDSGYLNYYVVVFTVIALCYFAFHNRRMLVAYVVEGKRPRGSRSRRRRSTSASGASYSKLENNFE